MSRHYWSQVGSCFSWLAALGLVFQPYVAWSSTRSSEQNRVMVVDAQTVAADVELRQGGVLVGQVVNAAGAGTANVAVELTNSRQTWQTKTDARGWFQVADLRGGTYQFRTSEHRQMLRAWALGTAPPKASQGVLVTPETEVFRGQRVLSSNTNQFFRVAKQRLANPLVVAGVVATAVAIPVAIHNADDDDPPATP